VNATFDVAILVVVYDRPNYLQVLLDKIAGVRPQRLYVFCDGPHDPSVVERMEECKRLVEGLRGSCEVHTLFLETNVGPGRGISSALSWFFSQEEEGIVFESDCIPAASFFPFCRELLDKYRHDRRVAMVCGNNFSEWPCSTDYFFSANMLIWGFATWRRVWEGYDLHMRRWGSSVSRQDVLEYFGLPLVGRMHHGRIENFHRQDVLTERLASWDFQLYVALIAERSLTILPRVNLVANIGYEGGVNHRRKWFYHMRPVREDFRVVRHPVRVAQDRWQDLGIFLHFFLRERCIVRYHEFRGFVGRLVRRWR
jgi:hypothetical protein